MPAIHQRRFFIVRRPAVIAGVPGSASPVREESAMKNGVRGNGGSDRFLRAGRSQTPHLAKGRGEKAQGRNHASRLALFCLLTSSVCLFCMNTVVLQQPKRLLFGIGAAERCVEEFQAAGRKRLFVVTGP